jgi:hypothetical protein
MRKNLSIFILLIIILVACNKTEIPEGKDDAATQNEVTPYFYYYKGNKKYLHLSTDYFFVSIRANTDILLPNATKVLQKKNTYLIR